MHRLFVASLLCSSLLPSAAAAPTPALDELVVTATRYARPLEGLPARVTVVSAEDLRRQAAVKLDEALALVAGVSANRSNGAYSYSATVSLRGLAGNQQARTLVLVDGVPVNTAATGSVNWNRIPIELVERVEVFKGPGSSVYGGDAVGGVINVITKRPRRRLEGFAVAEAATSQTDNQRLMAGSRLRLGPGELTLRAYGYHGQSGGYNSTPEALRTNAYASYINRYYREHGAGFLGGYDWSSGRAEFEYTDTDDIRGEGLRIRAEDGTNRRMGFTTFRAGGEGRLGEGDWRLLAYRQRDFYRRLNESQTGPTNYQRIDTTVDRRDYSVSGSVSQPLSGRQKLTAGGEFKAGRVNGVDLYQTPPNNSLNDSGKMDVYAVFLQDDWTPGDGYPAVLASLRYDAAHFYDGYYSNPNFPALSGPIAGQDWRALTWRASARQRFSPEASAYLSYSRGFRQPSVEDMVFTMVRGSGANQKVYSGNPDLGPERLDTYEVGGDFDPLEGLRFSPSLYYSRGWDFIYNVNTGRLDAGTGKPLYQHQNVGAVDIHGAEGELRCDRGPASLRASYTFNHSRISEARQSPGLSGNLLVYNPQHQFGVAAGWRFPWLDFSAVWRYRSGQFSDDANTQCVSPYSTLAFKAGRRLGAGFTLTAALENALNKRYQESAADLAPGRTARAALAWEFR
jgi:iron complex outermembrane receptor protein